MIPAFDASIQRRSCAASSSSHVSNRLFGNVTLILKPELPCLVKQVLLRTQQAFRQAWGKAGGEASLKQLVDVPAFLSAWHSRQQGWPPQLPAQPSSG